MTMPHMMNCGHSDEGWCLDCVKAMHDALSKKPHDGGPAFPAMPGNMAQGPCCYWGGMSLRDYFAAQAMQGMVPDMERMAEECARECATSYRTAFEDTAAECARRAYAIADAMLAERAKGGAA